MHPWSRDFVGRLDELEIDSQLLKNNALGDPSTRPLWVYTPPGYDADTSRRYPSIYLILGLTGQVDMWKNRMAFRPNVTELVDQLFSEGGAPPAVVVFADCWTRFGGSQYIDSPGTGPYMSYLCDEVVPFVDAKYRTLASRDHRGLTGKSSGGYGAMVVPMLRPDVFGGFATHAGDALFETCYLPVFRESVRILRDRYQGSYELFWEKLYAGPALARPEDGALLNDWCMAACYSADADGKVHLPYDPATGELVPEVWARWLEWDPVRMAKQRADALRSMRAIYVDAGLRDEFYLDLGALAFKRELEKIGVKDLFFELFDATHKAIEYRYPLALRYLAERLSGG
ncbi:MAG: enterochelin esterase [Myxococcales bacterium]|nr:enterochelin esterase [Myxococcales bacterium]